MIKIRGNFIRDSDGAWQNINNIRSFYVGGSKECGYRICFSYEHTEQRPHVSFPIQSLGDTHKTEQEAQEQLDGLMDLLEYEKTGD